MREVESLSVRANEPWEHAERFESLAGRLKGLDEELIKDGIDLTGDKVDEGKDSEAVKEGEEQPEEIRVAAEKPAVDASAWLMFEDEPVTSVDFDLQTVLMRIDEIHASMTVPEEEEVPSFAPVIAQPAMVGTHRWVRLPSLLHKPRSTICSARRKKHGHWQSFPVR